MLSVLLLCAKTFLWTNHHLAGGVSASLSYYHNRHSFSHYHQFTFVFQCKRLSKSILPPNERKRYRFTGLKCCYWELLTRRRWEEDDRDVVFSCWSKYQCTWYYVLLYVIMLIISPSHQVNRPNLLRWFELHRLAIILKFSFLLWRLLIFVLYILSITVPPTVFTHTVTVTTPSF